MKKFHQFLVLFASFIAQFISEGIMMSFTIYYPTLSRYFESTNTEISLIGSFSYGCWCGVGPFAGQLVEKFGSTPVLIFSGLFGSCAIFAGAYAVHLWHIIVTFSFFALCCGLALIPAITVITNYFTVHRHLATTAATIGGASGAVCYPILIQYLLINQTWQYCLVITAGVTLHLVVCGLILNTKSTLSRSTSKKKRLENCRSNLDNVMLNDKIDSENDPLSVEIVSPKQRIETRLKVNLALYAAHSFLWNLTGFAFLTILPLFLDHNGQNITEIAFALSIYAFTTIIGRCLAALYCIRRNLDRIFCYNVATFLTAIFTSLFIFETNFTVYCIFIALDGLFFGLQTALMVVVTLDIMKNQQINLSFGIILFACGMAGLISPFISGFLIDTLKRYDYVFAIISLPSFCCCLLMTHLHWPFKRCFAERFN